MKKENGFINFVLTIIAIALLIVVFFFGYMMYDEIMGDGTIVFSGKTVNQTGTADGTTSQTNVKTENIYEDKYLYNQLSDTAKVIYEKLYENKDNLKTGTYKVKFDDSFKDILEQENGSDLLKAEYQSAIEAFTYENPDVFYLDVTKMYINIEIIKKLFSTQYNVYIDCYNNENYLAEAFNSKEDVDKCEAEIEQVKNNILANISGRDLVGKLKYIHDYIIDNIEYDQNVGRANTYNIYGALVEKECVCEGYAKAYQYLLNAAGIENVIISGVATNNNGTTESHAWNYVKIDDEWYAVDTTWDDPVIVGGGKATNKIRYQYFLKGSTTMDKNHTASKKFTQEGMDFELPVLSVTDYDV